MSSTPPRELTAAEIGRLDIVEIIMTAPLDQAIPIAIGRASTCWTDVDGTFGMAGVFDDATATRIVDAILTRITCELAAEAADARSEDRARALIPTVPPPTATVERGQCPEVLRLEGAAHPSQCLLLEGHAAEHQNGNLRWRRFEETGEVVAWWDTQVYEAVGLGELLRAENVHLTLPHLPAGAAAELARQRERAGDIPAIDVGAEVRDLEARLADARANPVPPSTQEAHREPTPAEETDDEERRHADQP